MSRLLVLTIAWLFLSVPVAVLLGKALSQERTAALRSRIHETDRGWSPAGPWQSVRRPGGTPRRSPGRCPVLVREPHRAADSRPRHSASCPSRRRAQLPRRPRTRGRTT